jgi:hypothetical protein
VGFCSGGQVSGPQIRYCGYTRNVTSKPKEDHTTMKILLHKIKLEIANAKTTHLANLFLMPMLRLPKELFLPSLNINELL